MKKITVTLLLFFTISIAFGEDKLTAILKKELKREFTTLSEQPVAAYFISYRVEHAENNYIVASSGSIGESSYVPQKSLTVNVKVGDYDYDDNHRKKNSQLATGGQILSEDESEEHIARVLWRCTDSEYTKAARTYSMLKADMNLTNNNQSKIPDYLKSAPYSYYEEPLPTNKKSIDKKIWEQRLKKLSLRFKPHHDIIESSVSLSFKTIRRYYVSTEDVQVVENQTYAILNINAKTKADDGMILPLYKTFFAYLPNNLPSDKIIEGEIDDIIEKLHLLRTAPIVDPYTGPAILSGQASGVFFHEIFGHRIEAQAMKNDNNGQTFKSMLGQLVLPQAFNVYDDPSLRVYNNKELNGSYIHDEEGVKGCKVNIVTNGILKDFLTTKVPIEGFTKSNGHARATAGLNPTSRQSNLIIETTTKHTEADLRKMLIEEAKKQGKEYGFYMARVTGGFTNTNTSAPNSFNVTPIEVYRVYVDQRPDELVRGVDLVGTPLSMFSFITAAGGTTDMFSGMCIAGSGEIPVTAISPMLFVSKIEFQRKKSQENDKAILPRPY